MELSILVIETDRICQQQMIPVSKDSSENSLHLRFSLTRTFICSAVLLVCSCFTSHGVSKELDEYEAKALLVYNFIKYTSWPEGSFDNEKSPIQIAVVGNSIFFDSFKNYQGKQVNGRTLKIVMLEMMTDFDGEHVLYLSGKWTASTKFFMKNVGLKERPILTVGESEDFVVNGGVISIINENDHLALLTNPNAAKNSQLFLSSNLVKLSRQVSTRDDN